MSHPPPALSQKKVDQEQGHGHDLAPAAAPPLPPARFECPHGQEIVLTTLNSQFWSQFLSFPLIIGTFLSVPGSAPAHPIWEDSARPLFPYFCVEVLVLQDKFLQMKPNAGVNWESQRSVFHAHRNIQRQIIQREQLLWMLHLCLPARSRKGNLN